MTAIPTARGLLRAWQDEDFDDFAAMHADPEVQWDAGGPLTREESAAKFARYRKSFDERGFCRWAMVDQNGAFLGYVGVQPLGPEHPLGKSVEIGWRLRRSAWGALAALADLEDRCGLSDVFSFTAPDNLRSQAVMDRIRLRRRPELDFSSDAGWHGLVWST